MDRQGKKRFKHAALTILPVVLIALAAVVPAFLSVTGDAGALSAEEQYIVRDALNAYVANQFTNDKATEYGFVIDAPSLKSRIDSNGDGCYLCEGDDASLAPVLVDVLEGQAEKIPTTAVRATWNTTALQTASVNAVAGNVNNHEMAGFTTDVVVYCATGHTEAAAAGGFGAVAGAGGLGGSSTPKVLALKWGRAGWGPGNFDKQYTNTDQVGTVTPPSTTYADAGNSDATCNGKTGAELVRCTAERALSESGGNVGNGVDMPWQAAWQAIDLRPGAGNSVYKPQGSPTLAIPVNTIFNMGLNYLDPAASPKKVFVGDTQHMAGMIATGAEMLGYDSSFLKWGLANYNNVLPEKYTGSAGYAQVPGSDFVDTTRPDFTEVAADAPSSTSAIIKWTTDEPATSMVEYSETQNGTYTKINDTVLHASHSLTIEGLTEGTTYYFRVSSFDGMANGSTASKTSEGEALSFTAGTAKEATPVTTEQSTATNTGGGGGSDDDDSASGSQYNPGGSNNPSGSNNPGSRGSTGNPGGANTQRTTLPATGLPVAAIVFIVGAVLSGTGAFLLRRKIRA